MKIVLLVLSGDPDQARAWLQESYPGATVEIIPRGQLESSAPLRRLGTLRSLRPDVFAIATERLGWQRGQNALFLFGALGGAHRVILIDASGDSREESRVWKKQRVTTQGSGLIEKLRLTGSVQDDKSRFDFLLDA